MLDQRIITVTRAYEVERSQWESPPPSSCDAAYFRLLAFVRLDAPDFIIGKAIELLRGKIATLQRLRLGMTVH